MRLVGFNFNKISIEKFKELGGELKFNTKIDISSISPLKSDLIKIKDEPIKIDFVYSILYEPEFAKLELAGTIILSVEPKIAREVLRGWKDKELNEDFRLFIFNIILRKANIKALSLEEELNLPPHIPLPTLSKENVQKKED
ncbi:MAG: hypothetical protein AABX99_04405 [Nanoarchaeota archaeon]